MSVCRSPSGCWHEHRHCQYRYGLGSQYGEYLGFGAACSRGWLSLPPPLPMRSGARERADCGEPHAGCSGVGGVSGRPSGRAGSGWRGGERGAERVRGAAPAAAPGALPPSRLPASNGAPCRPRALTAPSLRRARPVQRLSWCRSFVPSSK